MPIFNGNGLGIAADEISSNLFPYCFYFLFVETFREELLLSIESIQSAAAEMFSLSPSGFSQPSHSLISSSWILSRRIAGFRFLGAAMAGIYASPSSPIASTGQPSMASLHCAISSSFSGCLKTYE